MSDAQGIKAGNAFVEVGADTSPLAKAINGISNKLSPLRKAVTPVSAAFDRLGGSITSIGTRVTAVGGAIAAAGAVIVGAAVAATKSFTDYGSEVADITARTGLSAKAASTYAYAIGQVGGEMTDIESAIKKMQTGLAGGSEAFSQLGLSIDQLKGLKPEQQFESVLNAIGKLPTAMDKTSAAVAIFGKSGTKLIPLADQFRSLRDEAERLGIALSDDQVQKADSLGDAVGRAGSALRGITVAIGSALAEPITQAVDVITEAIAATSKWIGQNQGLVRGLAAAALAAGAIGGAIVVAGSALAGVGLAISGFAALPTIVGAVGAAAAALGPAILPIIAGLAAAGAAAAGIGVAILEATGNIDGMAGLLDSVGRIFGFSFRESFYAAYLSAKKLLADLGDTATLGIFGLGNGVQKQIDRNKDAITQRKQDDAAKQAERDRARVDAREQSSRRGKNDTTNAREQTVEATMISLVDALRINTDATLLQARIDSVAADQAKGAVIGGARDAAPQNNLQFNPAVPPKPEDKRSPFRRLLDDQIARQGGRTNWQQRAWLAKLGKDDDWLPPVLQRAANIRQREAERQQQRMDKDQAKLARRNMAKQRRIDAQQAQRAAFVAQVQDGIFPMPAPDKGGKDVSAASVASAVAGASGVIARWDAEAKRKSTNQYGFAVRPESDDAIKARMKANPIENRNERYNLMMERVASQAQRFQAGELGGSTGSFSAGVAGRMFGGGVSDAEERKKQMDDLIAINQRQEQHLAALRDGAGLE